MISLLYSLWDSAVASPSVAFSMLLNILSFDSPPYFFLDLILTAWNLFHLLVAISFLSAPDAFYKKLLLQLHYKIVKFHLHIPYLVATHQLGLTLFTLQLSWRAYGNNNDSATTVRAVVALYTWACCMVSSKHSTTLVKMGMDHAMKVEQEVEQKDIRAWTPPPKSVAKWVAPIDWIFRPEFVGMEKINTQQPGLYVTNHALFGLEMIPFVANTFTRGNVFLRGLTDHLMFGIPIGSFIRKFGGVNGTRDNVDILMERKDNVLVYPGGGYELLKPTTIPNYTLMWRQRLGFAKVAIKHGYPVVPCACVGTEDMMDRLFDIDLGFVRRGLKCPVVIVQPQKVQKVYYWYGEPISTSQYKGDYENDEYAKEVKEKCKAAIEAGIKELQERQAQDPNRFLWRYMWNSVSGLWKEEEATDVEKKGKAAPEAQSSGMVPTAKKVA